MRFCDKFAIQELLWFRKSTIKLQRKRYTGCFESAIQSEDPMMLDIVLDVNPDAAH